MHSEARSLKYQRINKYRLLQTFLTEQAKISRLTGLRHVADLHALFSEYRRVVKPGGCVLLLELSLPASAVGQRLNRLFLGRAIPAVARRWQGREAGRMMDYFWETIENCVPPVTLLVGRKPAFRRAERITVGGTQFSMVSQK
jgi:ubiquinone/menaquinone biosynthesis C-methylase UbiE